MEENGNLYEVAGIDWGYTGPLQLTGNNVGGLLIFLNQEDIFLV